MIKLLQPYSLQWRHNEPGVVWNQNPCDCLLNRLFGCISKKTSKFRVTGLCAGTSTVTVESPALIKLQVKLGDLEIWCSACNWYWKTNHKIISKIPSSQGQDTMNTCAYKIYVIAETHSTYDFSSWLRIDCKFVFTPLFRVKFCTRDNKCATVACANVCSQQMDTILVTASKCSFVWLYLTSILFLFV